MAAKDATTTIPMVFRGVVDGRLAAWGISSLARPGGNLTGLTMANEGDEQKRLALLTRAVPGVPRVAVLVDPPPELAREDTPTVHGRRAGAHALGVQLQFVVARRPDDFDDAFAAMTRERAEALYVTPSVTFFQPHPRLMALA